MKITDEAMETGAAETSVADHVRSMLHLMERGARVNLTYIPGDTTFLSSNFSGEASKAMAAHIKASLSPAPGGVTVAYALFQLSDAIAREAKEREIADHVFTTLHVNIEKSEPTAELAEALRDYWLKEGKPALASHEPTPDDTQEGVSEAGEVVAWASPMEHGGFMLIADKASTSFHEGQGLEIIPLVRQSALTAYQQEVERLWAEIDGMKAEPFDTREGLSKWRGWDDSNYPWSQTHHKDSVLEAMFRDSWSVEDAAALLGFIDRTWGEQSNEA